MMRKIGRVWPWMDLYLWSVDKVKQWRWTCTPMAINTWINVLQIASSMLVHVKECALIVKLGHCWPTACTLPESSSLYLHFSCQNRHANNVNVSLTGDAGNMSSNMGNTSNVNYTIFEASSRDISDQDVSQSNSPVEFWYFSFAAGIHFPLVIIDS
jgi:hypothetical protein